mmetsp:Transcript_22285/g.55059  ORF Transcript_22285/g.55059 Transcript_22285/m.55059 type:complete len:142 (-) Transcript_22285:1534-1959(-)
MTGLDLCPKVSLIPSQDSNQRLVSDANQSMLRVTEIIALDQLPIVPSAVMQQAIDRTNHLHVLSRQASTSDRFAVRSNSKRWKIETAKQQSACIIKPHNPSSHQINIFFHTTVSRRELACSLLHVGQHKRLSPRAASNHLT